MRMRNRIWAGGVGFLPLLLTVATLAPLAAAYSLGAGVVVLGAAICLTDRPTPAGQARSGAHTATAGARIVRVVATAIGVSGLALAFSFALWLGDSVYLVVLLVSRLAGRLGPRWAAIGRALLLPLTALFLAPPVNVPGGVPAHLGWALAACLVASVWLLLVPLVLPTPRPRIGEVARAARAVTRGRPRAGALLDSAVAALDAGLAETGNEQARVALLNVQCSPDEASIERLRQAMAAPAKPDAASPPEEPDPAEVPSSRTRTRLALAATIGVALALVSGQLIFPTHWPWTVVTVITVSLSARSRGEVFVRSGQRLLGALVAAAAVTPLAQVLAPYPGLTVLAILLVLALGMGLRDVSRVAWSTTITATLAFLASLGGTDGSTWSLLGQRLAAIAVGGVCAIVPALLLAPRSRDVLRKRAAICLRRLRGCLDAPSVPALRRYEAAVRDLGEVGAPLRVLRRRSPHLSWYGRFDSASGDLRELVATGSTQAVPSLRKLMGGLAAEIRTQPAVEPAAAQPA